MYLCTIKQNSKHIIRSSYSCLLVLQLPQMNVEHLKLKKGMQNYENTHLSARPSNTSSFLASIHEIGIDTGGLPEPSTSQIMLIESTKIATSGKCAGITF